jgi:hypothetical protein
LQEFRLFDEFHNFYEFALETIGQLKLKLGLHLLENGKKAASNGSASVLL